MSERCFVKVEFDPVTSGSLVRRAVGGFLRYIQHRDLHPTSGRARPAPDIAGLAKYVAYRDQASARAELFGPGGSIGTEERKAFVAFVTRSIEGSKPQFFRTRAGPEMDRRRAVSRFLISPESAHGLDLKRLTRAAVSRLEWEMGVSGLRWIAAIHRNTTHHHVHLVLAGMHRDAAGGYRRVDISKARLAAMKLAIGLEIERQRGERAPSREPGFVSMALPKTGIDGMRFEAAPIARAIRSGSPTRISLPSHRAHRILHPTSSTGSVVALRAVARRYQRRMERELEESFRQNQWERVA